MSNIHLHKNIKQLRERRNWSQSALGSHLGIGKSMVSAYEKGRSLPSAENLFTLSKLFNVSLDDLVYKDLTNEVENQLQEPKPTYPKIGITSTSSSESMLRLVTMLEQELYELRERIKKEAPDLAERWGIR